MARHFLPALVRLCRRVCAEAALLAFLLDPLDEHGQDPRAQRPKPPRKKADFDDLIRIIWPFFSTPVTSFPAKRTEIPALSLAPHPTERVKLALS